MAQNPQERADVFRFSQKCPWFCATFPSFPGILGSGKGRKSLLLLHFLFFGQKPRLGGHFWPRKKIFSSPPRIPRRHPPALSWENPPLPPGIVNRKPTPAPSWRHGLPLPLPRAEKNKKYPKRPPRRKRRIGSRNLLGHSKRAYGLLSLRFLCRKQRNDPRGGGKRTRRRGGPEPLFDGETTIKIKFAFLRGGGGALGAERKIVEKHCFSWEMPRQ